MKNYERYWYHIFCTDNYTDVIEKFHFSETLISLSKKHNYKTFTKSPPALLLQRIENILNHSSGKRRDSLTIPCSKLHKSTGLCTIFILLIISD